MVAQIDREVKTIAQARGISTVVSTVAPAGGVDLTGDAMKDIERSMNNRVVFAALARVALEFGVFEAARRATSDSSMCSGSPRIGRNF